MQRRLPRLLICSLAACAPVLGLVTAVAPSASATTRAGSPLRLLAARHARQRGVR